MKTVTSQFVSLAIAATAALPIGAANAADSERIQRSNWIEDRDGIMAANEFRVIDPEGAVTRRPCPYTCEMRGFPSSQCREWESAGAAEGTCYVHDTRVSLDDAMPKSPAHEQSARAAYRPEEQR